MKRLSLLLPVLGIVLLPMPLARAAGAAPARHILSHSAAAAMQRALSLKKGNGIRALQELAARTDQMPRGHRGSIRGARSLLPLDSANSPSLATGSDLALPDSVVTAGNGTQSAITAGQGPFSNYHKTWTGFQSGVAAQMNFQPIMTLYYQGSVFADNTSATNYMTESFNLTSSYSSVTPTDCSSTVGVPCEINAFATTNGDVALYNVARVNYCVIEVGYEGDPTQINNNLTDVSNVAAGTLVLGIQEAQTACPSSAPATTSSPTPTPTPSPTATPSPTPTSTTLSYSIVKVQWAKGSTDVSKSTAHISKAKQGSKVQLVVYFNVDSAPPSEPVSIAFAVSKSGKQVAHGSTSGKLDATDPTGTYPVAVNWKLPKKTGTYVGKATVSMGGQTESGTAKIKDQKKK